MKVFSLARYWFWLAPIVLGVAFIAGGLYMVSEGRTAKDEVRDAIVRENITTSEDASIPNVQVNSAATAKAQAEAIEAHTLKTTGGETYATVDRYIAADGVGTTSNKEEALLGPDGNPVANPARNTAFQGAALRTSLNLAVMGFKVSDLVIGMGFLMVAIGGTFVLFLAPAVYYAAELANERNGGKQTKLAERTQTT
jgi:hypothetical protein